MYNLKIDMSSAGSANLLAVDSGTTPRTPEILNSLIAMTSPMDNYNPVMMPRNKLQHHAIAASSGSDSNSSSCSQERYQLQHYHHPATTPTSVQQTCSQLIKAGLKLSIEHKRRLHHTGGDSEDLLDLDKVKRIKKNESESDDDKYHNSNGLTPEDEERRRRRRERNKIAATKCRLKKRERTANLVTESEHLESQNVLLKTQLHELSVEHRRLQDSLSLHKSACLKDISAAPVREPVFSKRLPSLGTILNDTNTTTYSNNNNNHPQQHQHQQDVGFSNNRVPPASTFTFPVRNNVSPYLNKPPNIVVEHVNEDDYQQHSITNLDDHTDAYSYNNQQCHSYSQSQQRYAKHGIDGCMA